MTFIFGVAVGNAIAGVPLGSNGQIDGRPECSCARTRCWSDYSHSPRSPCTAIYPSTARTGRSVARTRQAVGVVFVRDVPRSVRHRDGCHSSARSRQATAAFERYPWLRVVLVLNVLAIANLPRSLGHGNPKWAFVSSGAVIAAFTFLFGAALFLNLIVSSISGAEHNLTVVECVIVGSGRLLICSSASGIGMPFVLGYTACTYWVFWAKRSHPMEE